MPSDPRVQVPLAVLERNNLLEEKAVDIYTWLEMIEVSKKDQLKHQWLMVSKVRIIKCQSSNVNTCKGGT